MTSNSELNSKPSRQQRGELKTSRIPIKVVPQEGPMTRKPAWIKAKVESDLQIAIDVAAKTDDQTKKILAENRVSIEQAKLSAINAPVYQ